MPFLPPVLLIAAGAVGLVALARFVRREYRRVNGELEAMRVTEAAEATSRTNRPTLRRDPKSGVYRP